MPRVHRWQILVVLGAILLVTGGYLARLLGALILAFGIAMLVAPFLPVAPRRRR